MRIINLIFGLFGYVWIKIKIITNMKIESVSVNEKDDSAIDITMLNYFEKWKLVKMRKVFKTRACGFTEMEMDYKRGIR